MQLKDLWSDIPRGFASRIESRTRSSGKIFADEFLLEVDEYLRERKPKAVFDERSRRLLFDPGLCMFEGFVEQTTDGFFDDADCPPPELWERVCEDVLVSAIPRQLIRFAQTGIDNSVTGTLRWLD